MVTWSWSFRRNRKRRIHCRSNAISADELIMKLEEHYKPRRCTTSNRGYFYWAKQDENETPENHWNKIVKFEKFGEFDGIKPGDVLIAQVIKLTSHKKLTR